MLGRALAGRRDDVVIATKWSNLFDEETKQAVGRDVSTEYLVKALDASLRRLNTDHIDLYQFHGGDTEIADAEPMLEVLEEQVAAGKIRGYAWSTDDPERARHWARNGAHCIAVQHSLSVFQNDPEMLAVCESEGLASINRSPLAMGLLTGTFTASSTLGRDDVRGVAPDWLQFFRDGRPAPEWLERVAAVRDVLTSGGRTPAQGALGWIWARSDLTIPIPGCRTVAQVEENAGALEFGPLSADQVSEIDKLLTDVG